MSKNPFSEIFNRYCTVFTDPDNQVWAYVPPLSGCVPLHSSDFREYFFATCLNEVAQFPSPQQFNSFLHTLAGRARSDPRSTHLPVPRRVAEHCPSTFPDIIRLDLANPRDQFVTISPSGYQAFISGAVHFEASHSARSLPVPESDHTNQTDPAAPLIFLRRHLNLASHADWIRCLAWLLACFRPSIPAPLAILQGPPSSGKSVAARLLRLCIDPSTTPFTPIPHSVRDLHTQVRQNFVLVLDHISALSAKITDGLCRLTSGIGISHREPGASSPVLRQYKRPVILTTTDQFACPDDLAERALTIHFAPLPAQDRKPVDAIQDDLKDHYPRILGAICNAVSTALRRLPEMGMPQGRHPDMLAWMLAAAPALGLTEEEIREALNYRPPDPTVEAVTHLLRNEPEWTGTATDLLHLLPASPHYHQPKGVTQHLKTRLATLAQAGITVEFDRHRLKRLIILKFHPRDASSQSSGTADRLPVACERALWLGPGLTPQGHEQL